MGRIYDYKATYSQYLELRKERREQQMKKYEEQQKMIAETKDFIERYKGTYSKTFQVQSRVKMLEKLELIEVDEEDTSRLRLKFPPSPRDRGWARMPSSAWKKKTKGHFDRVNDAVFDIIHHEDGIRRETILEYSEKHQVCPFEFQLDISLWCDVIIGDYNYVFDPVVYLKRFFTDTSPTSNMIFLVDEAHNLVDRAREMYSAALYRRDFDNVYKKLKAVSRQPLTNFVNLKSNTIMKKPRCKDTFVKTICQVFCN